ncbi:MAG: nucleoside deaminase [Firmicutes bacterium]|nr:nucleoside deaminase [Bacillota bacterium]
MAEALSEARKAAAMGEIPVGAVVVRDGRIVGRGHNLRETANDPTAHAEMVAIREVSRALGAWRLEGCTMYVTVEPCAMCAGAIVLARIPALVFGTRDPKAGACGSVMNIVQDARLNHRVNIIEGILAGDCQAILKEFFLRLRRGVGEVERARLESE